MAPTVETERTPLNIPSVDLNVAEERNQLIQYLEPLQDRFGVKTLIANIERFAMHKNLADKGYGKVCTSIARLNGERTSAQRSGDSLRTKRMRAVSFFNTLSTPALRRHCKLYELDYDAYEDVSDIIDALVTRHLEMNE